MRLVRTGSRGPDVVFLQERLVAHGFVVDVDGIFGPQTLSAVRQFQAAQNLKVDGIVGDRTWDALRVEQRVPVPPELLEDTGHDYLERARTELDSSPLGPADTQRVLSVLEVAIADLGKLEVPTGSNSGPQIEHLVGGYNQYWLVLTAEGELRYGANKPLRDRDFLKPMPWCGMAVTSWIRIGLGLPNWDVERPGSQLVGHPTKKWLGGVSQIETWAKDESRFVRSRASSPATPGQIFTMARSGSGSDPAGVLRSGHTGLVIGDDGDHVVTVEGNISDSVGTRRRRKTSLRGLISWW